MRYAILVFALAFSGCAGLKLKDLNKIDAGMSKAQVLDVLGEPKAKRMDGAREVYEYEMKDENGELKPRVVAFEDREVVFYGKPSEYKEQKTSTSQSAGGNTNTNTVSPHINVNPSINFNPVISVGTQGSSPLRLPAGNGSYFHEIPNADELNKANKGE